MIIISDNIWEATVVSIMDINSFIVNSLKIYILIPQNASVSLSESKWILIECFSTIKWILSLMWNLNYLCYKGWDTKLAVNCQ